jgi:UDP-N-acetylmuramoyl-tripeptide--D-alanyl-D-alanine ligase
MEVRPDTEAAVIEVGIDAPGNMIQHIDIVRPEVALVTAISEEHLEWLKDLDTIAREENLILEETARAGGTAVINLDDPWIKPLMQSIKEQGKIGFTLGGVAGPHTISGHLKGDTLEVEGLGRQKFSLKCPLPGEHNARNLLGAVAAALSVGVTPDEIEEGLAGFASSGGRSQMECLHSGVRVLCDFYNANPASMRAAFKVAAAERRRDGILWLCLADMKELGDKEETLHRGLASDILALGPNIRVMLYGERMKWLAQELEKKGIKSSGFLSQELMAGELKKHIKSEDFILLKGSRSMRMEKVWEALKV